MTSTLHLLNSQTTEVQDGFWALGWAGAVSNLPTFIHFVDISLSHPGFRYACSTFPLAAFPGYWLGHR
jgi:hypothetical protein